MFECLVQGETNQAIADLPYRYDADFDNLYAQ